MAKRKKRIKKPFWKKLGPEFKAISAHLGKITDNTNWQQIADVLITAGCFYAGYKAAENLGGDITAKLGTGFSGALAYKLATSRNLAAGAAGTAYLAALGLITVAPDILGTIERAIVPIPPALKAKLPFGPYPYPDPYAAIRGQFR